ncbi:PilZ domain-containing protein [Bdellovibrio sp. GT3]|uniref:PilZ domain-containing protein n=1 Tax=unclassified Bdellovibrio TaxID=2633795 RepID=UPI0030F33088
MSSDFQKMNIPAVDDKGQPFRRQYPRRAMKRKVGVLCDGTYFVVDSGEVGEGGMSIISDYLLSDGDEVVVSFQIPQGDFVFLRGVVRSTQKKQGDSRVTHGLSFSNINFATKRQIRAFVSARNQTSAA